MTEYLHLDDRIEVIRHVVGEDAIVRDYGLLESAQARPRAWVFGHDAYNGLHHNAAARGK